MGVHAWHRGWLAREGLQVQHQPAIWWLVQVLQLQGPAVLVQRQAREHDLPGALVLLRLHDADGHVWPAVLPVKHQVGRGGHWALPALQQVRHVLLRYDS